MRAESIRFQQIWSLMRPQRCILDLHDSTDGIDTSPEATQSRDELSWPDHL